MAMPRMFVAGATGVVGRSLVSKLVAAGYQVVGTTRTQAGADQLLSLGVEPSFVDVLDPASVDQAMAAARPEVVIEQLTALPKHYTPAALRDALEATNRVRIVGGGILQQAAERHGVRRYLAQSGAYFYAPGPTLAEESDAFVADGPPVVCGNVQSLTAIEERVLSSQILEGITLRYGFFYGPGTWWAPDGDVAQQVRASEFPITGEGEGIWPFIHLDDAVDATILAITNGEPGPYNIVDDEQLSLATWLSAYAIWIGAPPPPRIPTHSITPPVCEAPRTQRRNGCSASGPALASG